MELGQARGAAPPRPRDGGYAMAALLVGLSIMAVLMTIALPTWAHFMKREREEELIWRGQQYARAVGLFQRKYANTFPPTIDILIEQRFLRKKYKDPITNEDFQPIPAGAAATPITPPGLGARPGQPPPAQQPAPRSPAQPAPASAPGGGAGSQTPQGFGTLQPSTGIQGVVSKSKATSLKMYNGRTKYNEWAFVYLATSQRIGPGGPEQQGPPATPGPGLGPQGPQGTRPPVPFGPGSRPGAPPAGASPFGQPNPFSPPPPGAPRPPA